jgi:cytochrome c-type biogenesis protein CcsB
MRSWVHRLGSIKVAVALLIVVLVALAAGTIVETMRGPDTAGRLVYDALWFRLLLGAYAFNLLCSLADLFPWGPRRIGFVLTHGSMLLILCGALTTALFKTEGDLALWEGETGATFRESGRGGVPEGARQFTLPFSVRLDAFEIDHYMGTQRPAMFRSRVTVSDPATGAVFPAVIEMNRGLSHAGYHLYQSGYHQTPQGDQTILLVSRDPGEPVVLLGYALLLAGMITVLATRIAQHRRVAQASPRGHQAIGRVAAAVLAFAALHGAATAAGAAVPADAATADRLRLLPVQHDGRVMPLDTYARETVRAVTGEARWKGFDPTATVLGWAFDETAWTDEPMVRVEPGFAAAIGLPPGTRHASWNDLRSNGALMSLMTSAHAAEDAGRPPDAAERGAADIEQRMLAMREFLGGEAFKAIPAANPNDVWLVPPGLRTAGDLVAVLEARPSGAYGDPAAMQREALYNRVRPSRLAWLVLAPATLCAWLAWRSGRRSWTMLAIAGLLLGFAVMTWGIATRWAIAGHIPASNMYESLLFLGWGVGLFALVALLVLRNPLVVLNAAAMSALTMALTDLLPIDPFMHPMAPVLSGTPWLAIHVPIIMLSYSVLALGVVIAHMQVGLAILAPARRDTAARMNELLYWYTMVGTILLAAGIMTGSVWAASSWGRYWGWDPKEVWSLVAFLAYIAILHGRFDRLIGPFGVAALSIVAFWTILMTYIGVNFVLATGMHSYGFGGDGVVRWMLLVAAAEGLFLALGGLAWSRQRGPARGPRPVAVS